MAKMNNETRKNIVEIFKKNGFDIILKSDGTDEYKKNLLFKTGKYKSNVYIHRDTGISTSGNMSYLKVAVHPEYFKATAVNSSLDIEEFLNARTKINRHSSSNYLNFPKYEGNKEPCGKCYKVKSLGGLDKLLSELIK